MSDWLALRTRMSSPMQWLGFECGRKWLRVQSALQLINQCREHDMVNRVLEVQSDIVVRWHEIPAS
jgi:hypothetical protein